MKSTRPEAKDRWTSKSSKTAMGLVLVLLAACTGGGDEDNSSTTGGGGTVAPPPPVETRPIIRLISSEDSSFADGDTRVTMNGQPIELADLRTGDRAIARGTARYENGVLNLETMHFDSIDAYQLVVGPVDSVDVSHGRLVVLGQLLSVTSGTAVEGEAGDVSVLNGGLATVEPGHTVAISGYLTASGEIVATRIARHNSNDAVLLRGFVAAVDIDGGIFRVGGIDVGYWQATLQDFPADHPTIGDQVLVLADTAPSGAPLQPHTVRFLPRTLEGSANTGVRLEGVITRYAADDDFDVNGLTVRLDCSDCSTELPRLNGHLWIEGVLDADGVVSIRNWNGFIDLVWLSAATITAIDAQTGALTVYGSFQVQPSATTRYRNGTNIVAIDELHDGDLHVGDVVDTSGDYGGVPGLLLATAIYRHDPGSGGEQDSVRIFSERFELAEPAVIVLGRPILTNSTTPVDRCGEPSDTASLFSAHPDTVSIDLPAHPLDPLEATRLFFTDANYPCAI